MFNYLIYIALFGSLLAVLGSCTDDEVSKIETEPISLLRIKDGRDDTEAPRSIVIKPEQESVSVFYTIGSNYENHELVAYEVTDETIDILYDNKGLSLTDIDNRQYEDEDGNIYQMEFYTENIEED